ncbi:hypothetical protein PLICRDRAFT_113324 [Plicaturopsis crispa FD-325 SS-3]|nr:hypothetical protein PLICRDRAFT_113324 [Plicaturopsis crispa FD-325 SS-3]
MFRSGQANPYDDIVNKTTDENLTGENWELILNLCDKVQDEGEQGARNVIAAVLKRLAHRNPNVQLYALSLAESLSKNCTIVLHREIASRAFTQGLEKIITDRTTHEKVKRRALGLVAMWTAEFEKDPTLGIMEECYNSLKAKNYKFEAPQEPPPPTVDDEVRRREEEELQRVLEMSVQDKGGRQWNAYSAASTSGAGGSGSSSSGRNAASGSSSSGAGLTRVQTNTAPPTYQAGYVAARTPSPQVQPAVAAPVVAATPAYQAEPFTPSPSSQGSVVTRVRALHTFEPTEPGELAFEKGDVIKVVDRGYKDWWRGQLKGRTGIFPVNYVEPMPEPTAAELAREAEQEHAVFAQAANVDKLLTMLRSLDPTKDNLADNEEIQELYRSSMALRPKIVKLIDKYNQKRADLVSMNDSFMRARTIFDQMMEESLARHTGVYETRPTYRPPPGPQYPGRAESRARQDYGPPPGPQAYGWNPAVYDQPGYNAYPAAPSAYTPGPDAGYQGPSQPPYIDPQAYAQQQLPQQPGAYPPQPYGALPPGPYGPQVGGPSPYGQPPQHATPQQDGPVPAHLQQQQYAQPPVQQQQPQPVQVQQQQQQPAVERQQSAQTQVQPQAQQVAPQPSAGPPYAYDPHGTYADPNVQAWATYYAQGGKDLTGAVYFISVPGVTDGASQPPVNGSQEALQPSVQQQPQSQPQAQPQHLGPAASTSPAPTAHDPYQPYRQHSATQPQPQPEHFASTSPAPTTNAPYQPYRQQSATSEHAGYNGQTSQQSLPETATDQSVPLSNPYPATPSSPVGAQAPAQWSQAPQAGPVNTSPTSPHAQPRQPAYQPPANGPPASAYPGQAPVHQSLPDPSASQPPYSPTSAQFSHGAGAPSYAPQIQGDPNTQWHSQYAAVRNQFAGLSVNPGQHPQEGQPGVGAEA